MTLVGTSHAAGRTLPVAQGALPRGSVTRAQAISGRSASAAHVPAVVRAGWFPWLPVWLSCGIGLWFALRVEPGRLAYGAVAFAGLAGLGLALMAPRWGEYRRITWAMADALRLGGLALAVAAAGFGLAGLRSADVAAPIMTFRYYGPVEGRLIAVDRSSRDRTRLTLDQVVLRAMPPDRTPKRVRLALPDAADDLPKPGARVMMTGYLLPPPDPSSPDSFDFRRQAWFNGLGAVGYTRDTVMLIEPARKSHAVERLRLRLSQAMQDAIPGQAGAVAAALMTGDRSGIEEVTNAVMRDANLYHIVSISGLHMSMLAGFVYTGLRMVLAGLAALGAGGSGYAGHKLAAVAALCASAVYLRLSGGGAPTERAFVMVAVFLGAILVDRRAISLRTIALAALILLAAAPEALTQPGFQMSFAATVALILSYGPWSRVGHHIPLLIRPVALLLFSSLVAEAATTPIAAAQFNRMPIYGLLANLLVVPVMGSVVMPAGVIAALLAPLGLAAPALWVMGLGTRWMLAISTWIAGLDGAVIAIPAPPGWVLPGIGLAATILALVRPGGRAPAHMVQGVAVLGLVCASVFWALTPRPLLLIGREAEAVGLMTPAGRSASKPGAAYTVGNWLVEDGDPVPPGAAAERPGWSGPRGLRHAELPDGRAVYHLTGKGAAGAIAEACQDGALVVAAIIAEDRPEGCRLFDLALLRKTGAVALRADGSEVTAADVTGHRPWTDPRRFMGLD